MIARTPYIPGEKHRDTQVSFEQAMSDIAFAYSQDEKVEWIVKVEEADEIQYNTVIITHDEGFTAYNWQELL